ncbi:MAG TPA: dihydrolipoamide acetyltransferase family protein, partial [Actinomycetota bacterium]|nr:dihydrolipoamide acetyltransferase family protein [Actinomycetota bacterium]
PMSERVFTLPDLGEGLEEGEIVSWLVAEGDDVALNQPLVEVETAKATVEIPSPYAGRVAKLHGGTGDAVPVGAPLVTFEVEGVAGAALAGPERVETPDRAAPPTAAEATGARSQGVTASPAVRRLARDLDVALEGIRGTGPDGRVTADDVRAVADGAGDVPATDVDTDIERVELTPVRRTIARRLEQAAAVPAVTTFRTVDCTEVESLRADLGVSPLPVVIAALCRTVDDHPLLNAEWTEDAILVRRRVHVGVAVDTERGLIVPVVRDAPDRAIGDLASEVRRLAEAARSRSLRADDVSGATLSVSNTGSYGSEAGTPLLNPPNAVTLAVGAIRPRALVTRGGAVEARPACTLSLTFDHRVLDGAAAGRALTDLVDRLQDATALRDLPR